MIFGIDIKAWLQQRHGLVWATLQLWNRLFALVYQSLPASQRSRYLRQTKEAKIKHFRIFRLLFALKSAESWENKRFLGNVQLICLHFKCKSNISQYFSSRNLKLEFNLKTFKNFGFSGSSFYSLIICVWLRCFAFVYNLSVSTLVS